MARRVVWLLLVLLVMPLTGFAADPHLPEITVTDLAGESTTLPAVPEGERRLVILSFQRSHTSLVASWMGFGQILCSETPGLDWYQLPLMGDVGRFARSIIGAAMRGEYKSPAVRSRIFPLYGPSDSVIAALQVDDTTKPLAVLIDAAGVVSWQWEGEVSDEAKKSLREAVAAPTVAPTAPTVAEPADPAPTATTGPWKGFADYAGATQFCDGHVSGPPGAPHIQWDAYATSDAADTVRSWYRETLGADDDGTWRVPADTPDRVLSVDPITSPGPHTACETPKGANTVILVSRMTR